MHNVRSGCKDEAGRISDAQSIFLQAILSRIGWSMSDSSSPHPAAAGIRACPAFREIPFEPVPVKKRHDGWTAERQRGFIDRLCVTGGVARAARAMGKTAQSVYRLREHPGAESFARA
jgi:hypothetical protein